MSAFKRAGWLVLVLYFTQAGIGAAAGIWWAASCNFKVECVVNLLNVVK